MEYQDRIFGECNIEEPVIVELIGSPALQRLKKIDQMGYQEPYFPGTAHSRFEHSVGVFLWLRKYGSSIEEQIAGLIHDISHGAFSHCLDYVLAQGAEQHQRYQDDILADFVKKSEIAGIIKKYGLDLDYILDENHFPLKEKPLPDLCADRIDYSIRDALCFGELRQTDLQGILDDLITENNQWVFQHLETAQEYADLFLKLNQVYYSNIVSAVMFKTVGDYLLHALQKDYIIPEDLFTTDEEVLTKINQHLFSDYSLQLLFDRMNNRVAFRNDPNNFDVELVCKSRSVDPWCYYQGKLQKVSDINKEWGIILAHELKPKHYFLKFDK